MLSGARTPISIFTQESCSAVSLEPALCSNRLTFVLIDGLFWLVLACFGLPCKHKCLCVQAITHERLVRLTPTEIGNTVLSDLHDLKIFVSS